ncbi:hypothetical protein L228DRAFT_265215 [Xylona heveae TC161]|uniref:WW domain-containing protein n=1 Tax=Xylona heveae (strain CBS 132557 / TC161) TaxID=1328760 RepID=A0A165K0R1_XYLHT|nr:hypothetical protein L228DRAFT_265215 [Xylona heveae TC161]KZF26860.1 hypothetical protein L228DRAFT_265215 [Xylona heveae TC161]
MATASRSGRADDELFLRGAGNEPQTPTVEPLRINKRDSASASPPLRTGSAGTQQSSQAPATKIQQPLPYPSGPSTSTIAPTTQLPYPDDRFPRVNDRTHQAPYPEDGSPRIPDAGRSSPAYVSSNSSPRSGTSEHGRFGVYSPARDGQPPLSLGERRGNVPKPLPESPGPDLPDKEGLFQKLPQRQNPPSTPGLRQAPERPANAAQDEPYADYRQQYRAPTGRPAAGSADGVADAYAMPTPGTVHRLPSTASISTTRAQRGSPPPPETPAVGPGEPVGGGIEARYAASGIAGTATLNSLQAQNAAAAQRAQQYTARTPRYTPAPERQEPPRRPWTPTELPGTAPHGPPTVYQGPTEVTQSVTPEPAPAPRVDSPASSAHSRASQPPHPLEQDIQRLQMTSSPPPAYTSVTGPAAAQRYPAEKQGPQSGTAVNAGGITAATSAGRPLNGHSATPSYQDNQIQNHPAFANDPRQAVASPGPGQTTFASTQKLANTSPGPGFGAGPASPPPLPEGWIAHLDPNSGQYYYIHLPTQSTQWEFPKGPTPLNLNEPLSPTISTYGGHSLASPIMSTFGGKALASPGFPSSAGYAETVFNLGSPPGAGFTGPPPSSGVDIYRVAPTNGVYFGPYLRYTNMDLERGIWLGSILLVTDAPQPPTIHIHQSIDLSPNPRQLKANPIFTHQRWVFYRYEIDLRMEEASTRWTYAITSHLGCTRYEFLIAGRYETNWRFIAHSGNDFSLNVNANERSRLGGVGYMWKDIMQKHVECGGFHVQLGLGDQIYADRLWKEIPLLKQWLVMSGKENRKNAVWTAQHEEEVSHAYFHYYTSHFDQPHLREAFAQIPHILQIDDHDIFDGFGSYPEYMQFSQMFRNIGRIGIEMYLLFQHHTTLEILRNVSDDVDLFTITGTGWHFVKYLGPALVVVGPDCRSERNPHQVMAGPTYQGLFPKVALLPPSVQHCIWMISVPLIYPRLETAETIANTVATGKKAVTGAYNVLGKVTSSVAGVVGAKNVVGSGFESVKRAVGKSGLMGGILSPFGEIDMLDELRDQWTHESKDLERTYFIRTLQGIAHQKSLRMTIFSGDVNCCGAGLVHDPTRPSDHKTMYQIIASSVVNVPPPSYILKLLHNNKPLYVPANGHRSTNAPSDTKEDMMEIFQSEPNGTPREQKKLMGRRNYAVCVAYDPEVITGTFGQATPSHGGGRLSLAVDFMVQADGGYAAPVVKYGPVIIPSLEYGR